MDITYNDENNSSDTPHRSSSDPAASPASSLSRSHNDSSSECERIRSLRQSLGVSDDIPTSVLRAILEANDREASQLNILSQSNGHVDIQQSQQIEPQASASYTSQNNDRAAPQSQQQRRMRTWDTCQNAPSRPGIIRIDTIGTRQNIGQVDEAEIYSRRVEAVHLLQENLLRRIGRNVDRVDLDRMQHQEEEGERTLHELQLSRPSVMEWPIPTNPGIRRREPFLPPPPDEPLPLPDSFTRIDGDYELCIGIFVDGGDDEECKMESSWSNVSIDDSPLGENEHVVRCYKCRAGLRVPMSAGLVICPRCRDISPAADVVNIRR
ncbi:hypothetical protein ACHAXN_010851 [Cyclotella atomus]